MNTRYIISAHEHIRRAEKWSELAEELANGGGRASEEHDVAIDMAMMHARVAQAIMRVHYPAT